jgi:hypothetical protein
MEVNRSPRSGMGLPPRADNPFLVMEIEIEEAKPGTILVPLSEICADHALGSMNGH